MGWSVSAKSSVNERDPVCCSSFGSGGGILWLSKSWVALLAIFIVALGLAVLIATTIRDLRKVDKPLSTFWKMRSRYGAFLVHTGILMIMLGIVGVEGLSQSIQGTLVPGDKMPLGDWGGILELTENYDSPEYLSVRPDRFVAR